MPHSSFHLVHLLILQVITWGYLSVIGAHKTGGPGLQRHFIELCAYPTNSSHVSSTMKALSNGVSVVGNEWVWAENASVNGKNECGGGILSVLHLGVSVLKSSKFGNWKLWRGLRRSLCGGTCRTVRMWPHVSNARCENYHFSGHIQSHVVLGRRPCYHDFIA